MRNTLNYESTLAMSFMYTDTGIDAPGQFLNKMFKLIHFLMRVIDK